MFNMFILLMFNILYLYYVLTKVESRNNIRRERADSIEINITLSNYYY